MFIHRGPFTANGKEQVLQKAASKVLDATRKTHLRFIPTKGFVKDQISSTVPGPGIRPRLSKSWSSACVIFLFYLPWSWRYPSIWNTMCHFMESYFVCFLQKKCVLHTCITSETDSLSFQPFSKAPSSSRAQHFCNNDDNHWNNINHLLISLRRQDICFTQYRSKLRRLSQ